MNNRRKLVIALGVGALVEPLGSFAQQPTVRMRRIGFLGATSAAGIASRLDAFRAGLRDLGYIEGKNLMIEFRWAEGKYDRLPELAAELVRLNVELIVTHSTPGSRAAKQATATIPIIAVGTGDPVAAGLVASEAHPGGNITGLSFFSPELAGKRIELLKEIFPRIRRVGVLFNSDPSRPDVHLKTMKTAAETLKLELQQFGARSPIEFENAFAEMRKRRIEAITINEDPMLIANVETATGFALKQRIPANGFVEVATSGGLIGYGVSFPIMYGRAAVFVDKILKGTKPADIPIERATIFELVVNGKTAKTLGIKIPKSILVRADKVIE
jgi:putative ABC transport system substrate-binding protein